MIKTVAGEVVMGTVLPEIAGAAELLMDLKCVIKGLRLRLKQDFSEEETDRLITKVIHEAMEESPEVSEVDIEDDECDEDDIDNEVIELIHKFTQMMERKNK